MRPNTVHYVLTVDDSIVYGRHLFPVRSMQAIASGIIHTFILNYTVTNTLHDSTLHTMLRRMMGMWTQNIKLQNSSIGHHLHAPDISTVSGMMDLMTLGKLVECSQVLDRRSYEQGGIHWTDEIEIATSRWRFRRLLAAFSCHWTVTVDGVVLTPWSLFLRLLVEFAAAIVVYKQNAAKWDRKKTGCTKDSLKRKMVDLFTANYPELLPHFHRLVKEKFEFFYWTGPPIHISYEPHHPQNHLSIDFVDKPIFSLSNTVETPTDNTGAETNIGNASKAADTCATVSTSNTGTGIMPKVPETHATGSGSDKNTGIMPMAVEKPIDENAVSGSSADAVLGSSADAGQGSNVNASLDSSADAGSGYNTDPGQGNVRAGDITAGKRARAASGTSIYSLTSRYIILT